jgi:hypothetical protein
MLAVLDREYAVMKQARRPAPHRDIAVAHGIFHHRISALGAAELEGGRLTE